MNTAPTTTPHGTPIQVSQLEQGDLLLCGARFREVLHIEPRSEDLETGEPTEFYVTTGGKDRARRLILTADMTVLIRGRAVSESATPDPEHAVIKAADIRPGYMVKLPEARRYERIDSVSTDDLGRIVVANGWGSCPLQPDDLVKIQAITGLTAPAYLTQAQGASPTIRTFGVPSDWHEKWPCSRLAGCTVRVSEDDKGDLLDLRVTRDDVEIDTDDLESAELSAAIAAYAPPSTDPAPFTAPHEQLHPGQLIVSSTETLRHAEPANRAEQWEVRIAFTYAGAGSTVSGYGSTEQGAAVRAANALADALAQTDVHEPEGDDASPDPAELDGFLRGYVTCALWSSNDADETPLDDNHDAGDIDPDSEDRMRADCKRFMLTNETDLEEYAYLTERPADHQGHDLWLTRNHHGTGFWDRDLKRGGTPAENDALERIARSLTDAAHALGESDLYVGDDGKIWVTE